MAWEELEARRMVPQRKPRESDSSKRLKVGRCAVLDTRPFADGHHGRVWMPCVMTVQTICLGILSWTHTPPHRHTPNVATMGPLPDMPAPVAVPGPHAHTRT